MKGRPEVAVRQPRTPRAPPLLNERACEKPPGSHLRQSQDLALALVW